MTYFSHLILWTTVVLAPLESLFYRWRSWGLGRILPQSLQGARPPSESFLTCHFTFDIAFDICSLWTWLLMSVYPSRNLIALPKYHTHRFIIMKQKSTKSHLLLMLDILKRRVIFFFHFWSFQAPSYILCLKWRSTICHVARADG